MIKTFQSKINGTRKTREFVAYAGQDKAGGITIQSDDCIAVIYPGSTGRFAVHAGGAYFPHLVFAKACQFPDGTYLAAAEAQPQSGDVLSERLGVIQA